MIVVVMAIESLPIKVLTAMGADMAQRYRIECLWAIPPNPLQLP
jgi:hypothetical protein